MELQSLTLKEIARYREKTGKRGAQILSILGRVNKTVDSVLNTDVGNRILQKDILRAEDLLFKIARGKATEEEKIEYQYLFYRRIPEVADDILTYLKLTNHIKEVVSKVD